MAFRNDREALEAKVRSLESENEDLRERLGQALAEEQKESQKAEDERREIERVRGLLHEHEERSKSPLRPSVSSPSVRPRVPNDGARRRKREVQIVSSLVFFGTCVAVFAQDESAVLGGVRFYMGAAVGWVVVLIMWLFWILRHPEEHARPLRSKWMIPGVMAATLVMGTVCYFMAFEGTLGVLCTAVVGVVHPTVLWLAYRITRSGTERRGYET